MNNNVVSEIVDASGSSSFKFGLQNLISTQAAGLHGAFALKQKRAFHHLQFPPLKDFTPEILQHYEQ
jgi:hypothetical protein